MAINLKQGFVIYGLVAVVLFMVGRCTAPKPDPDADRIKRESAKLQEENDDLRVQLDLSNQKWEQSEAKGEAWHKEALEKQKEKIVYRTRQNETIKRIDSFDDRQLDSAFRARYPGTYGDR